MRLLPLLFLPPFPSPLLLRPHVLARAGRPTRPAAITAAVRRRGRSLPLSLAFSAQWSHTRAPPPAAVIIMSHMGVPPTLAPGWSAKLSRDGRLFYVNHATKVGGENGPPVPASSFSPLVLFSSFLFFSLLLFFPLPAAPLPLLWTRPHAAPPLFRLRGGSKGFSMWRRNGGRRRAGRHGGSVFLQPNARGRR